MKSIFKILVLGVVPILMATAVVDQGLAADKGSQLIFQSNMAHTNFISVANTSSNAVTVLVQYYNNDMERVVWYLRVILGETTVLVDAFNHMIPGSDPATNIGDAIMASGKTGNGHFVIAVTAVGANLNGRAADATDQAAELDETARTADAVANAAATVNVLFPTFLAEDLHGTDNIDNGGTITSAVPGTAAGTGVATLNNNLMYTKFTAPDDDADAKDNTSKNVGDLNVKNAEPIAFNHLTGHFTEALLMTGAGGSDQTASWGGTPVVRPAVDDMNNTMTNVTNYKTLNGANHDTAATPPGGGRLAEKDAGGMEVDVHGAGGHDVTGFFNTGDNLAADTTPQTDFSSPGTEGKIVDGTRNVRGLNGGALVLPALHGGGTETKQIMLLLSVADDFGGAGKYKLMSAMSGYKVIPMDQKGNPLDMKAGADDPVFGSGAAADDSTAPSASIIVKGINVMTNANLAKCTGTMIDGPWTLSHLTDLVPEAMDGGKDFAGLGVMLDGMVNASPGWVKFERAALTCKEDYGDGDAANLVAVENADGIPVEDERTYMAGTLIVDEKSTLRTFVTTGRALLKYINTQSTFAASWALKSPASPVVDGTTEDGDLTN